MKHLDESDDWVTGVARDEAGFVIPDRMERTFAWKQGVLIIRQRRNRRARTTTHGFLGNSDPYVLSA